jgi:hypothetical protein
MQRQSTRSTWSRQAGAVLLFPDGVAFDGLFDGRSGLDARGVSCAAHKPTGR